MKKTNLKKLLFNLFGNYANDRDFVIAIQNTFEKSHRVKITSIENFEKKLIKQNSKKKY